MKRPNEFLFMVALLAAFASCKKDDTYTTPEQPKIASTTFAASGDSANIVSKLTEFRTALGSTLNSAPGAVGGRREINWDGVPASLTNNNTFPFDFFNATDAAAPNGRKRGLVLTNTGTSFRVDSTDFSEIDASYASQFEAFSRKRLFTYIGSNITEVTFRSPGTNTPASVKGFGVIFSDVDDANSTTIEYFNDSKSLGIFKATAAPQGFSLLGVTFADEKVTRVKITSGVGVLGAGVKDVTNGGTKDLVVMDDFFYDEPKSLN